MLVRRLSLFGIVSGLALVASTAVATDWTVANTSANVRFTVDRTNWQSVTGGMLLPNNAWIDTGKRGRVTLSRGKDTINLTPGTLAGVFDLGGSLDKTVVTQQTGTVALDVTHKWAPWMSVNTPFLAAVVKGTKFEVSIVGKKAEVKVERGIVEVTDSKRGDRLDVVAGQVASVDKSGKQSMSVTGDGIPETKPAVDTKSKKSEADIENDTQKFDSETEPKHMPESKPKENPKPNSEVPSNNGHGNSGSNGNSDSNGNGNSGGNGNAKDRRKGHSGGHD